ncbi:MAG: cbb3-type cytochrome oxidase assembly protein CcoS [Aquabacterium sp.]
MDILYLLLPLSLLLLVLIIGIFGWAVQAGQFDSVEHEGRRILDEESVAVDRDQGASATGSEESPIRPTHGRRSPGGTSA